MFDPSPHPRVFGLPPGSDFAARIAAGVLRRAQGAAPETLAGVELFVNTRRMHRRLREMFASHGALLLPRIRLVTEIADAFGQVPRPAVTPLRRKLALAQLVRRLIEREPDLAARSAVFPLADSLAALLDEMQGEGVDPGRLAKLDVSRHSAHWERSLRFLSLVEAYVADEPPGPEGRQRAAAEALAERWRTDPPQHPVIVAGSTGSRGSTALFMAAVARLPQGAVVLPGFDFDLAAHDWSRLGAGEAAQAGEDHPQYRFARFAALLGTGPESVAPWDGEAAPNPARNRLVSLALRPAPATDAWMTEGPRLGDVPAATAGLTLIEAAGERIEAVAIALRLRAAVESGQRAALISPDRNLTRRVAAALDRWGIEPDDSAGRPLSQSAPGRLLLQAAELLARGAAADDLIAILKHPLVHTAAGRGDHLRHTRDLELHLRRHGPPYPKGADILRWAGARRDREAWARWLAGCLVAPGIPGETALADMVERHLALTEALSAGSLPGQSALWMEAAGEAAQQAMQSLAREAPFGGSVGATDYLALLKSVLEAEQVRDPIRPDPRVTIWGTLEARVQGADLAILGGLNDGTWPELPPPDPWLNRQMRREAGLLSPERRIGLSAHDFQQAIAAREVVLSRSRRSGEAETVPSRWLNRLTTLLAGIAPGPLAEMRARGAAWLAAAEALESPRERTPPARRPAPRPPAPARPRALSVTEVERLIRDPYAIYARHVLGLRPLEPLRLRPDARQRGSALHHALEVFVRDGWAPGSDVASAFRETVRHVLAEDVPWPGARASWSARLMRAAEWFLEGEAVRRAEGRPLLLEAKGSLPVAPGGVTITGKADRIDLLNDGTAAIFDYKTGNSPTAQEQRAFDKQLPLLAALARKGAFPGGPLDVARICYLSLGSEPKADGRPIDAEEIDAVWRELARLLEFYADPARGYVSRRAPKRLGGPDATLDYDHLARYGEWEPTDRASPEDVG